MNKDQLIEFIPDFKFIEESPLIVAGDELAYHTSVISKQGFPLGTGFDLSQKTARIKAVSEAIERRIVENLIDSADRQDFLLDEYPTSCGFAVGMSKEDTKLRAISEAVERWLRSKWIDDKYRIEQCNINISSLSRVERYFYEMFDEVLVYAHSNIVECDRTQHLVKSLITVGLTSEGAFVGSKSVIGRSVPIIDALVESWRHKRLSEEARFKMKEMDIIDYFAKNKNEAINQIEQAQRRPFPQPQIRLLKEFSVPIRGVFSFRALCNDFIGWHGKNIKRFVY